MELSVFKRESMKKGDTNKLRLTGNIPAVIYTPKGECENIYVRKNDFEGILKNLKEGRLSNTVLTLKDGEKTQKVLVKDIQYHVTTYNILHLDFMAFEEDRLLKVKIPVECVGVEDCAGIKLGGVLRRVIRKLKVKCLPKDIPECLTVNVVDLVIGQAVKLKDIALPENITPLAKMEEVAVTIAKR